MTTLRQRHFFPEGSVSTGVTLKGRKPSWRDTPQQHELDDVHKALLGSEADQVAAITSNPEAADLFRAGVLNLLNEVVEEVLNVRSTLTRPEHFTRAVIEWFTQALREAFETGRLPFLHVAETTTVNQISLRIRLCGHDYGSQGQLVVELSLAY